MIWRHAPSPRRNSVSSCYKGAFVLQFMLCVLALRQQLAVLKRKHPRPALNSLDRLFWTAALLTQHGIRISMSRKGNPYGLSSGVHSRSRQPAARDSIPITGSGRLTTTGRVRSAIRPGADCGSLRQRTDRRPFGVARVATFRLASMPFRSAQSQASGVSLRRGPATPYRPAGRRRCKLQRRKRKKIFQSTRVTDSLV